MNRALLSALGLLTLLLLTFSCSEDASNSGPAGGGLTNTGGRSSGGASGSGSSANSGGSKASGGTGGAGMVGAGGALASIGGAVNTGGAAGSVMCSSGATVPDLTNCDAAKVAAFFRAGKKCEGCHFQPDNPADFTMNRNHEFHTVVGLNALVGRVSTENNLATCATRRIVDPGNPEGSLMYVLLKGTPPEGCYRQMPKQEGARPQCTLTTNELKCVADWINSLPPVAAGGAGGQGGAGAVTD